MSKDKTLKICLIGNSFSKGGAEKAHAVLSRLLTDHGLEVHNVLFEKRRIDYDFSGTFFELDFRRHSGYLEKTQKILLLNRFLKKHHFDSIIDFRYRGTWYTEWILVRYLFAQSNYFARIGSSNTNLYFTTNTFIARHLFAKAKAIISVSQSLKDKIQSDYGYKNIVTIYNGVLERDIITLSENPIDINSKYIVSMGRMTTDNVKQQDVIIKAYSESILPSRNIKLVLLGDGENREILEKLVSDKKLNHLVLFKNFLNNPYPYLKNALFMVLASKYEGFPNAIIESLMCGTPVISYNCPTGPSEIIRHRENGLLVENQNQEELIKAMNLFYEDKELYHNCKAGTVFDFKKFGSKNLYKSWLKLLSDPS